MASVSIIITTHNRVQLLKRAIDSPHSAGTDVEVIVVDDASADETQGHCRGRDDIKYVRLEKNVRTAGARNAGIEASQAEFIAFLDDDDWRLPGSIDKQIAILNSDKECGLVYGQFLFADQEGNLLNNEPLPKEFPEGDVFWRLLKANFLGCLTVVFRKNVIDRVGLLDTSTKMYGIEDLDLWIRIAEFYGFKAVREPVAVYRLPESGSRQWSSDQATQYSKIASAYKEKWLKLPRVLNEPHESLREKTNDIFRSISDTMLYEMASDLGGTRSKMEKAMMSVRCYPNNLMSINFYKAFAASILRSDKQERS